MVKLAVLMLFLIGSIQYSLQSHNENALNTPQILLPYAPKGSKATTFLLRALRGCFKWTSTKPHVVTVSMISASNASMLDSGDESDCSQSALVIVKMKTPSEDDAVILAEEEGSDTILRCDVFVDTINHLEIATTARELLLGEAPEVFDVYAYDKEGNLFSTLGSTTFEWGIDPLPHVERADLSVLRMKWFQDASYETSKEIYELESQSQRGGSVLIEGISTGDAIVSARLSHPEYKDVVPARVKVTVLDNVMLIPPDVYILVDQVVHFSAYRLRREKQKILNLPSEQYSLKLVDSVIGRLNESDASVSGLSIGVTKLQLIDKNTANLSSARLPTATIHVVDPGKIGFAIKPGKLWSLQNGKDYHMHVLLFDADNNPVKIDSNTIFDSMLSTEHFDIHFKSENGSYFYVQAKKVGKTALNATLAGVRCGKDLISTKHLFGEQDIEIYDPVSVTPKSVLFPWDPLLTGIQNYQYQLLAAGGTGNYLWSHGDSTVASVNKKGIVSAGSVTGVATIKVSDARNKNNFAMAEVTVLPPTEMAFVESVVEALVGAKLKLSLAVAAKGSGAPNEKLFFKDCRKMQLEFSFSDDTVFKVDPSEVEIPGEGCTSVILEGLKIGHTTLTATYSYADVSLHTSVVVGAYEAVNIVDPYEFATVTLGSKKRIIADAGPLPWILDSSQYFHVISAEEEEWVKINPITTSDDSHLKFRHVFDINCIHLGEQLLTIAVFNKPTAKNKYPASSYATTRFVCISPASMKLVPLITLPEIDGTRRTLESCKDEKERFPVLNNRDLTLHLMIYDPNGNLIDDASSLNIEWTTDDVDAAVFSSKDSKYVARSGDSAEKLNTGVQVFAILRVNNKQLPVTVTATITGYRDPFNEQVIASPISTNLHLITIPKPEISPNNINVFAHPSNQVHLDVSGGTQEFVIKSKNSDVKFTPPQNILVTPLLEGSETVYLYDACLDLDHPAEANLYLSDIYMLELETLDKVEIGKNIGGKCKAFDKNGKEINAGAAVVTKINMQLRMSHSILDIRNEAVMEVIEKTYVMTGKSVGVTSLTCQAVQSSGTKITSKSAEVQVFSPIELNPKYLLLIVGSIFQIHSHGGPRPHSTTVYSCENDTVAEINQFGLVTANAIGKTEVKGKAKGVTSSGEAIIYSEDITIVEVIQLKGFKISLKSRNLITDTEVGVLSVGITDEGPFTFATSPPYLQFHWSSSNHKVAVVDSFHYKAGVSSAADKDFRGVIRVRNPGQVTIKLKVEVLSNDFSQVSEYAKLEDEIQVQVFEKLKLLNPKNGAVLLPNHGIYKIQTNKDQMVKVTHEILPSSCSEASKDSIVVIGEDGLITTSSSSGIANVLVTAHEAFGFNQSALVHIEVKSVALITLVSHSLYVIVGNEYPSFPLGSSVNFGITLHDNVARKFDVSRIPLMHTTTRSDVAHIIPNAENSSLVIKGAAVGETILKVWHKENPSVADYVRISIQQGITPSKTSVTLGGVLCFSPAIPSGGGLWSSSGNLVSIDEKTGIAVGLAAGSTIIHYHEGSYNTYTEVNIVAPSKEPLIISNVTYISNGDKGNLFYISFDGSLQSDECRDSSSSIGNEMIPFACHVQWVNTGDLSVKDVFLVQAVYIDGKAACSITPQTLSIDQEKSLTSTESMISIHVKLTDKNTHQEYLSLSIDVPFIPKLVLEPKILNLDSMHTMQSIKIFASAKDMDSLVVSSDSSAINLNKFAEHIEVSVDGRPTADITATITVSSQLTKHSESVLVVIKGESLPVEAVVQCPIETKEIPTWGAAVRSLLGETSMWIIAYTVILATIILLILIYHLVSNKRTLQPVLAQSPYGLSPFAPLRPAVASSGYVNGVTPYNTPVYPVDKPNAPPPGTLFSVSQ